MHQVFAAFGEVVLGMLTDDVWWTTPGPPDVIPHAGSRKGHDEVAGYFEAFDKAIETTEFGPQKFFVQDNMVVLGRYALHVVKTEPLNTDLPKCPQPDKLTT
jgi:ketosteroid isomerase-like protein